MLLKIEKEVRHVHRGESAASRNLRFPLDEFFVVGHAHFRPLFVRGIRAKGSAGIPPRRSASWLRSLGTYWGWSDSVAVPGPSWLHAARGSAGGSGGFSARDSPDTACRPGVRRCSGRRCGRGCRASTPARARHGRARRRGACRFRRLRGPGGRRRRCTSPG